MKQTLTCFCGASMSIDTGHLPFVQMKGDETLTPDEYMAVMRAIWWKSHAECFKWDEITEHLTDESKISVEIEVALTTLCALDNCRVEFGISPGGRDKWVIHRRGITQRACSGQTFIEALRKLCETRK